MAVSFKLLRGETTRVHEGRKGLDTLLAKGWTLRGLIASGIDAEPERLALLLREHERLLELSIEDCDAIGDLSVLEASNVISLSIRDCAHACDLEPLKRLPKLRDLSLFGGNAEIPELPELELLTVGDRESFDPAGVARLPLLKSLKAVRCRIRSFTGIPTQIPVRTRLQSLLLEALAPDSSLDGVGRIATLRELAIRSMTLGADDRREVGRCGGLKRLDLGGTDPGGLDFLAGLGALEELDLSGAKVPPALVGFPAMKRLARLSLAGTQVEDVGPLAECPALEDLDLSGTRVRDLAHLARLPLRRLVLGRIRLSKDGADAVARKPGLEVAWRDRTFDAKAFGEAVLGARKPTAFRETERAARIVSTRRGGDDPLTSHFGGTPWLAAGEPWPLCGNCRRTMPLFLQVDLEDVDQGAGLLQLFYCNRTDPRCEEEREAWTGESDTHLLRVVEPAGRKSAAVKAPVFDPALPVRAMRFARKIDHPSPADLRDLFGIPNGADRCLAGDKIGGWPRWMSGPEWPECPDCASRMDHLMQIESERGLAASWGAGGRAHLFRCAKHPKRLRLLWQR